jgi:hypothetical protein
LAATNQIDRIRDPLDPFEIWRYNLQKAGDVFCYPSLDGYGIITIAVKALAIYKSLPLSR